MSGLSVNVLVQVHIPKCAGTSVSAWLRDSMKAGFIGGFGSLYDDKVYSEWELWESALYDDRVAAISGHGIRVFPSHIGKRRLYYFTILREPPAQFRSMIRYMIQERARFGLPPELSRTADLMSYMLAPDNEPELHLNGQVNHLALYPWCATTGGRCKPDALQSWARSDRAAYLAERLDIAKSALRGFLAVGTVERLKESLDVIQLRSFNLGIALLPASSVQRLNVTAAPLEDDTADFAAAGVPGGRLYEILRDDRELYASGAELLARSPELGSSRLS